jgi:hypothetical protein
MVDLVKRASAARWIEWGSMASSAEQPVFALTVFFAAPHNVFGGALLAPCHDPSILPQAQRE